ncbi:hypothetical protein GCM10025865_17450 [Paraoerskovia sediminicola]|uniref:EamA domain-containing protein n=1 Tax=Paraoerskovia sediminicola TaxID=1138587 RepID=A0ABN6XC41_9CELL|nr:hypothetical protein GCM10025865_17450 [Paraoerskovia sediminicola]
MTALAPVAWGSTYLVTREWLPADAPLWGAVLRALPAGLLLLALRPRLPHGRWWWRSAVLGTLTSGAFYVLVYVAAQLLPASVASTVMAASPAALMLVAWPLLSQRPRLLALTGAAVGVGGVALLVGPGGGVNPLGVAAAVAAMLMSAVGYALTTRWARDVDLVASTAWQLVAGGLVVLPFAVLVEGGPPAVGAPGIAAYLYVAVVATALASVAWFGGLRRLPAGTVGLLGLLNPLTGVLLGVLVAGEVLGVSGVAGIGLVLAGVVLGRPRPALQGRTGRRSRPAAVPSALGAALEEPDDVAVRVGEHGPPARRRDLGLRHLDGTAELGHLRERVVDRVDLDVAARLREPLAARGQTAAADPVRRTPHGVALEPGHLGDLPAEQSAVEPGRPVHVGDRDVDVCDVSVCHDVSSVLSYPPGGQVRPSPRG